MERNLGNLIFVYNANSGNANAFLDTMHKMISPKTYDCKLCDITFGLVAEKKEWRQFRNSSGHSMVFLHKDEFNTNYASKFGHKFTFPIVLLEGNNGLEVLISTEELNSLKATADLIELVKQRT